MTRFDWLCFVGIVLLLAFLAWLATGAWPQGSPGGDPLEQRLDAIEAQIDLLLQQPPAPPSRPRIPTPRRRRVVPALPAETGYFAPQEPPLIPRPPALRAPPPPPRCCRWTWAEVEHWRAFRAVTRGD